METIIQGGMKMNQKKSFVMLGMLAFLVLFALFQGNVQALVGFTSGDRAVTVPNPGVTLEVVDESLDQAPSGPLHASGWTVIMSEDFEGAFPGSWAVFDNDGATNGEYHWAKSDCQAYAGSYGGWAVGGGSDGSSLSCGSNYPSNASSWMVYGPFSLADATAADLSFKLWINAESADDYVARTASINGVNFYGSYTSGWIDRTLDLTNVPTLGDLTGQANVWIALVFVSDGSVTYSEGAYVDDIVLRKDVPPVPTATAVANAYLPLIRRDGVPGPTPTPITPTPTWTPTPIPTSSPIAPQDGNWTGQNDQGRALSFSVAGGGTTIPKFTLRVGWGGACGGVSYTTSYFYDIPINNLSFSGTSGDTEVGGTFTGDTTASGTYDAVLETYYPYYCKATRTGTWTASTP
jgi:hypothetical protein